MKNLKYGTQLEKQPDTGHRNRQKWIQDASLLIIHPGP